MRIDPIFEQYQIGAACCPGFEVDFLGAKVSHQIEPQGFSAPMPEPAACEAYFEYADILKAVAEAGDRFAMLELGAGFGRWSAIAAKAAAQIGKPAWFGLVEAEPALARKIDLHLADNGVTNYRVWPVALGAASGQAPFAMLPPPEQRTPGWLGQSVTRNDMAGSRVVDSYCGFDLWQMSDGWGVIYVPQVTLSGILEECEGIIDLADFDIQGAEADVIAESVAVLTRRVKRLHIGTHGHDIEARLRRTLDGAGWALLQDFPCHQVNTTPVGRVSFVDGVQSWWNPWL